MPKTPIDYQNTFIYKLVHKDDLDDKNIYIGHSTNFKQRKKQHKCIYNNSKSPIYNSKVYQFIRENGGWNCWDMLKVEDYPCKDVYEAKNRERYWIKELRPSLNNNEPLRTMNEYRKDNSQKIKDYQKKYIQDNKDYFDENKKCKVRCDVCGCEITKSHIKRHQRTLKCLNAKKNNTE